MSRLWLEVNRKTLWCLGSALLPLFVFYLFTSMPLILVLLFFVYDCDLRPYDAQ